MYNRSLVEAMCLDRAEPSARGAAFGSGGEHLAAAERAGVAVFRKPRPDATPVEVVLALQGSDFVILLEGRKTDRARAAHEVLLRKIGQPVQAFRAGSLLRNGIVQAEKYFVVLGSDFAGEKAVDFHRRQPTRQDRIYLHVRGALVRSPAVVAAVRGLARMTVAVV